MTGHATVQDSINFKIDAQHVSDFLNSPEDTFMTRLHNARLTHTGLMKLIFDGFNRAGGIPVADGMWSAGRSFARHDEYMIHAGVRYRPKASTPLPYVVGVTPDLNMVEEAPEIVLSDLDTSTVTTIGTSVARSLAERFADVTYLKDYGAVGDGIADDTNAFKNAALVGGSIIGEHGKHYIITDRVSFLKDNTTVNLQGSKVEWKGTNTNVPSYQRTNAVFQFTGAILETANNVNFQIGEAPNQKRGADTIVFPSGTGLQLAKGDWINFNASNNTSTFPVRYDFIAQVREVTVDGGKQTVRVRETLPWPTVNTATVRKIKPLFNCGIFNYTQIDKVTTNNTNSITGCVAMRCVNFMSSGVDAVETWNPVFGIYGCRRVVNINGESVDPRAVGGGRGYYVQYGSCRDVYSANLVLDQGRHVIDWTASARCTAMNCSALRDQDLGFTTHGQWEYDINIINCTGGVGIAGSSKSTFGNVSRWVNISNTKGRSFQNFNFGHDVSVDNCEFETGLFRAYDITLKNSKFNNYVRIFAPIQRENLNYLPTKCEFYGGYITFETFNQAENIYAGANPKFIGTYVNARADATGGTTRMGSFKMVGGTFDWGFRPFHGADRNTPSTWHFEGTTFRSSTFILNENVFAGATLIFDNCSLEEPALTGLIRNALPTSNGIVASTNWVKSGSFWVMNPTRSMSANVNVIVKGGVYAVPNTDYKVFDLGSNRACLDMVFDSPVIQTLTQGTGTNNGQFILFENNEPIAGSDRKLVQYTPPTLMGPGSLVKYLPYKHQAYQFTNANNRNLNDEKGDDIVIRAGEEYGERTYYIKPNWPQNDTRFTTNNYPFATKKLEGFFTVRVSANREVVEQVISALWPGESNHLYRRVWRGGSTNAWSSWKNITL